MVAYAREVDTRILWRLGRREEAEAAALQLVRDDPANFPACRLLREIRGRPLGERRCLRLLVHGSPADGAGEGAAGAYTTYYVNATDDAEALAFVREVEGRTLDPTSLVVEEVEDVTDDPERPHYALAGVVARSSGYAFYDESAE